MSQITERDELMLSWLDGVRLADLAAIRVALTAFGQGAEVIGLRRAQRWVLRMVRVGLVDRTVSGPGGPVHWVTSRFLGHRAPNPFQQTARHSVAIATVSARYLMEGYSWRRDEARWSQYLADGIAERRDIRVLVEVELTQKMSARYSGILGSHARRLANGEFRELAYFGSAAVMKAVRREIDQRVHPGQVPLMTVHPALDHLGRWVDEAGAGGAHLASARVTRPTTKQVTEVLLGKH